MRIMLAVSNAPVRTPESVLSLVLLASVPIAFSKSVVRPVLSGLVCSAKGMK